ncbi:MAG: radical SAM protein [Polyangiaceae bacterium]|nr:radical SAM protein [Polyangiaceae bacterium]
MSRRVETDPAARGVATAHATEIVAVAGTRATVAPLVDALRRVGPRVFGCSIEDARARASALLARIAGGVLVMGEDVPPADGAPLVEAAVQAGAGVVWCAAAPPSPLPPEVVRASARALSPAFSGLLTAARGGGDGALARLSVRCPAGRRQPRPASVRTPFFDGARQRLELTEEEQERLAALAADAFCLADVVVPGAARALEVTELVAAPGADRLVAHARVGDVFLDVELDLEQAGEGPLELEATLARSAVVCRFTAAGASLSRVAALSRGELPQATEPAAPRALRHALAVRADPATSPASSGAEARALAEARRAIAGYRARVEARPVELVLVHVPRFRNVQDELELPSLAAGRLAAFARGHGFRVAVVDLEALFGHEELSCFADDARVDAWLAGADDPQLSARVERLGAAIDAPVRALEARGARGLVGLSIVDYFGHFQANLASCLARRVKSTSACATVLGGERDQVDGDRALGAPGAFDYVVDGDGEAALLGLLHLVGYGDRPASTIPGVWSRGSAGLVKNKLLRSHLNAMPRPDFDDVDLARYRRAPPPALVARLRADGLVDDEAVEPFAYLPYAFVKGCTAKCEFCSAKEWLDVQSPEKTADELQALAARHGVRDFVLLDNLVNVSPRLLERLCRRLIDDRAGLQWTDSCRPTGISRELAAAMRESGCLLLNYGAESGSDKILTLMKKGLSSRDIVETLQATHAAGIINRVNFIAGYFHETPDDVDLTIRLVESLSAEIDVIGCFQGFYLFPGMGVDEAEAGVRVRPGLDRLRSGQTTLAYDEIGGLPWEEKRDVIDSSRARILSAMEGAGIRTLDKINEHGLFWMSRRFDKATVKRYLLDAPPSPAAPRPNQAPLPPGGQRGRVELG